MTVSIEGLNKELEEVAKSMELSDTEIVTPEAPKIEEEVEVKEEEVKEEEKEAEVEGEEKPEEEVVEKSDKKEDKKEDKEKEEVEKAEDEDEKEDVEKSDDEEDDEDEKKEKKEDVKKSAEALPEGAEMLTFMEQVTKSVSALAKGMVEGNTSVSERLERIEKSVLPMIENIAKHFEELKAKEVQEAEVTDEVKEEEEIVIEAPVAVEEEVVIAPEAVAKSANEDEDLDGKGVEYIEKSANTPEAVEVEEEVVEEVFKAIDHVAEVVAFCTSPASENSNRRFLFGAVDRVKGGRETQADIAAFKTIVGK
ncbi:hypothetical protein BPS13_0262 [Bacillus phage BPS13]|uniref:Uncharacterized protein n=2 Tax=Wphvirus BPS13 TaxID=1987727 RepID=A0A173GBY8_9CAUD|nr:hypothetical protein BPS13_0262 [Bacillus phage BPS13]YP_009282038.1 hypothetical protein SALINJAH_84 [Bacillus phage SalinJah]AEZ50441.1 hypothetical protein BPS13_0262 [Bacillus phage BPS13]ANH50725.1 hypothetical protein SALINJAH_84 [Bacillus phage SalinJah]QQO38746.1 major capsid protein [Bacillus phage BCPG1]